jgi:nucleoid-associated protein YgaU
MPAEYAAMYRESLAVHERYEVQEGDAGLFAIALFVYNDGALWPKLWLANVDLLPDPDDLAPGMVLRIPAKAPLTAAERAAVAARAGARRR